LVLISIIAINQNVFSQTESCNNEYSTNYDQTTQNFTLYKDPYGRFTVDIPSDWIPFKSERYGPGETEDYFRAVYRI
jgi:hypothetical protein